MAGPEFESWPASLEPMAGVVSFAARADQGVWAQALAWAWEGVSVWVEELALTQARQ